MELAPVILLLRFLKHMIGNMTFIMTRVESSIKKSVIMWYQYQGYIIMDPKKLSEPARLLWSSE